MIKYFDVFSGIGGFAYAAQQVWGEQLEIVGFCEIEESPQQMLRKNFPGIPIYPDITKLKGEDIGTVDILTGGFPCQPFSIAGERKGSEDERALFPEMLRLATETKARWIVAENVYGIVNSENGDYLETIITLMENQGYEVQPYIIPASAVGAPHRRDRIWIVAYSGRKYGTGQTDPRGSTRQVRQEYAFEPERSDGCDDLWFNTDSDMPEEKRFKKHSREILRDEEPERFGLGYKQFDTNSYGNGLQRGGKKSDSPGPGGLYSGENHRWETNWYEVATRFCRVDDGVSDRVHRLKALGNAIVPQVAMKIFETIKEIESL